LRLLVSWILAAASLYVAAILVPGVTLEEPGSAFVVAAAVAVLNAILPPVVAALRLPFMLALGFILVLVVDALILLVADDALSEFIRVDSFGDALLASLVMGLSRSRFRSSRAPTTTTSSTCA
jgi:putative membrane protein